MAASAVTPPPGFELEKPASGITPPPGFELEKPGDIHKGAAGTPADYEAEKSASGSIAPPLRSYGDATRFGLSELGEGVKDFGKGAWQMLKPPSFDEFSEAQGNPIGIVANRGIHGLHELGKEALQVPGAISDLYHSPDPVGSLALAAPRAAGQGAAQAATAAAPEILPPVVRGIARGTNAALEKAPGLIGASAGGAIGHATGIPAAGELGAVGGYALGKEILPRLRVPGESFGEPKAVYPGAPLPETPAPELLRASALGRGARIGNDPSAGLGEIPVRPGSAGSMAESVEEAPHVRDIPKDEWEAGKQIGSEVDNSPKPPILERLRASAQNIAKPKPAAADKPLTGILKKSVREVERRKGIAKAGD